MTLIYVLRVKKTVDMNEKIWYNTNRRIKPDNRVLPSKSAQWSGTAELCAFLNAKCKIQNAKLRKIFFACEENQFIKKHVGELKDTGTVLCLQVAFC